MGGGGGGHPGAIVRGATGGQLSIKIFISKLSKGEEGERESEREGQCWLHLRRYGFIWVGVGSFATMLLRLGRCWLRLGRCWLHLRRRWFVWVGLGFI